MTDEINQYHTNGQSVQRSIILYLSLLLLVACVLVGGVEVGAAQEGPTADFEYAPAEPLPDEQVTFDASASEAPDGEIVSYEWEYEYVNSYGNDRVGDTSGESFTQEYSQYGEYEVSLTVETGNGSTDTVTKTVSVTGDGPTADFSVSPPEQVPDEEVTFDASGSEAPSGEIVSYEWDYEYVNSYGNDRTGEESGKSFTREYRQYGEYEVTLTVEDNGGKTASVEKTVLITGNGPTANFSVSPPEQVPDEEVTFDASGSKAPSGEIVSYDWEYEYVNSYGNDRTGEESGESFTREYSQYGEYEVTLTVEDNGGKTASVDKTVSITGDDPIADFSITPSEQVPGEEVKFDASESEAPSGEVVSYEWEYEYVNSYGSDRVGDTTGESFSREYSQYGEYEITLTVEDNGGETDSISKTVVISGEGPTANFEYSPKQPGLNDRVVFDASATDASNLEIREYQWFIDGEEQRGGDDEKFDHKFTEYGIYKIELAVTDAGGKSDRVVKNITVGDEADRVDNAEFGIQKRNPETNVIESKTGDQIVFRTEVVSEELPQAQQRFLLNGEVVSSSPVESTTARYTRTFDEPGEYTVTAEIVDPTGKSATVEWNIIVEGQQPEITQVSPTETELLLLTGSSQAFEIESDLPDGTPEYTWQVDGTPAGSGSTFEHQFSAPGTYEITGIAAGEGGITSTQQWQVTVRSLRSPPVFAEQSSADQIQPGSSSELLTFSVRNPSVNEQPIAIEIVTELPDGVSITGAKDVTEGDAGIQALVGTVSPGDQESMQLAVAVDTEDIAGDTIEIPYQIRYYPQNKPDEYQVAQERSITFVVESSNSESSDNTTEPTDDESPGFGVTATSLAVISIMYLLRKQRT